MMILRKTTDDGFQTWDIPFLLPRDWSTYPAFRFHSVLEHVPVLWRESLFSLMRGSGTLVPVMPAADIEGFDDIHGLPTVQFLARTRHHQSTLGIPETWGGKGTIKM
jgi:hypothetical protein